MKTNKNKILALTLTLLVALPLVLVSISTVDADEDIDDTVKGWPVEPIIARAWYKFETPLITLLFPAQGRRPMFLWWYTNDSSEVYVVKFKGLIEYLTFDFPYYDRRFHADNLTIRERLRERYFKSGISDPLKRLMGWLIGLHAPYLPFNGCTWRLEGPNLVSGTNTSYWSFNFTLDTVLMCGYSFAEENVHVRCRFYNTSATETIDEDHNYTVAAGQLKFDFVASNWRWNVDQLKPFLEIMHDEYSLEIPPHRTGLALWINMASIKLEDIDVIEEGSGGQSSNTLNRNTVEAISRMKGVMIGTNYYPVTKNETQNADKHEIGIRLTRQLRKLIRISFAKRETSIGGFLEFVPWARLLDETGAPIDYVNVTASYIAAGSHLRLFLCYPYFGNYTLEHDPTIGLASVPAIPTFVGPGLIIILIGATMAIAVAVAAVKIRKKPVNILKVQ